MSLCHRIGIDRADSAANALPFLKFVNTYIFMESMP